MNQVICEVTQVVLAEVRDGRVYPNISYGVCPDCGRTLAATELHFFGGRDPDKYPIIYENCPCLACWELPTEEVTKVQ